MLLNWLNNSPEDHRSRVVGVVCEVQTRVNELDIGGGISLSAISG
jgi:hypothetical protein